MSLLKYILPYYCILCDSPCKVPRDLCEACFADLPWLTNYCDGCGNELTTNESLLSPSTSPTINNRCGKCLQLSLPYEKLYCAFHYDHPMDRLIYAIKFKQRLEYARAIGECLLTNVHNVFQQTLFCHNDTPDFIIPIPLHKRRLYKRGFNQALELIRPLAKHYGITIATKSCCRWRATHEQARLKGKKRISNVNNAFMIRKDYAAYFYGKYVLVVDDVITTGATMQSFCKLLNNVGCRKIIAFCIAKAR